jgi:Ni,Fe-hydrogenase III small subunit
MQTKKSISVPKLLWQRSIQISWSLAQRFKYLTLPLIPAERLRKPRAMFLRHLDCGSCGACEFELQALNNPLYDIAQYGIQFVASPRHADTLVLLGPFTRNLAEAARQTFAAMSEPKRLITVGDCAANGGIYKGSDQIIPRPPELEAAIVVHILGCPPSPTEIRDTLLNL